MVQLIFPPSSPRCTKEWYYKGAILEMSSVGAQWVKHLNNGQNKSCTKGQVLLWQMCRLVPWIPGLVTGPGQQVTSFVPSWWWLAGLTNLGDNGDWQGGTWELFANRDVWSRGRKTHSWTFQATVYVVQLLALKVHAVIVQTDLCNQDDNQ